MGLPDKKTIGVLALVVIITMVGPAGCSDDDPVSPTDDGDNYVAPELAGTYVIVDTEQSLCYDNQREIDNPAAGVPFCGQDAQHDGAQPSYVVSDDGLTVYDEITGLTWVRSPDSDGDSVLESPADKLTWTEAQSYPAVLNAAEFGGYDDWRLPTIKELYSLILFSGEDVAPEAASGDVPFIDTEAFTFVYGNTDYGINAYTDNGDGTVTDDATGLMWAQNDSGIDEPGGLNWEEALAWVETQNAAAYLGYDDWRLPNVKELQSIVDYTRSPATTGSAAINPVFGATGITNEAGEADFAFYWSGTTHANSMGGGSGAYVAFGRSPGYMNSSWVDVHGAGSQRSDPKTGDPADYPTGHGPQGDAIRIYNMVRLVRGG